MTSWTRNGPPEILGRMGGPSLGAWRHPVLMVGTDPSVVDRLLFGGELACPGCGGQLRPWGYARGRRVREEHAVVASRPRRSCCSTCRGTHVLLPASMLVRRADAVVVIGAALAAKAAGVGHRPIAGMTGRPVSTVRGWLRRFGRRAEGMRVLFTGLLHALDPGVGGGGPDRFGVRRCPGRLGLGCGRGGPVVRAETSVGVRRLGQRWPAAGPGPGGQHELTLGRCSAGRQPSVSPITT